MNPSLPIFGRLLDVILTVNFGILWVPLAALMASPLLGLISILSLLAAIPVARRAVMPREWKSEYGWSLLVPGVGFWLRRRLVREQKEAAAIALHLAVIGGLLMLLLSLVANHLMIRHAQEHLRPKVVQPATALPHTIHPDASRANSIGSTQIRE